MLVQLNRQTLLTSNCACTKVRAMFTYFAVFSVFIVGVGWLVAKLYEWRQDVLYGAYVAPDPRHDRESDVGETVASRESAGQRSGGF